MSILDNWNWRDWVSPVGHYFLRVGDALSQLINVLVFFGSNPNESISGRSWRLRDQRFWGLMVTAIDFIASPIEESHCQKSYEADVLRAKSLISGL